MRLCGCVGTTKAFAESRTIEGVGETKRKRERETTRVRGKEGQKGRREQREKDGRKGGKWWNAGPRYGGESSVHRASSCIPKCVRHCFNSTHA